MVAAACGIYLFGMPRHLPLRLHPTDVQFLVLFAEMVSEPRFDRRRMDARIGAGNRTAGARVARRNRFPPAACGDRRVRIVVLVQRAQSGIAERHSLKDFSREIQSVVPSSAQVDYINSDDDCDLDFYTDYAAKPIDAFNCGLARPDERLFLVLRKDHLDRLGDSAQTCLKPVARSRAVDRHGPCARSSRHERPLVGNLMRRPREKISAGEARRIALAARGSPMRAHRHDLTAGTCAACSRKSGYCKSTRSTY